MENLGNMCLAPEGYSGDCNPVLYNSKNMSEEEKENGPEIVTMVINQRICKKKNVAPSLYQNVKNYNGWPPTTGTKLKIDPLVVCRNKNY